MARPVRMWLLSAAALALCLVPQDAGAQYFGRNKVQYDRENIRVLATEHFDIYYSSEDVAAAQIAGRLAERWYARLSRVFDHTLRGRQPVVLYGSHRRFEQTNVYQGLIDESTGGFTDSRRRRIVLPFSGSVAETDHVLGHELVHAFQFDIADQYRTTLAVPLWFVEGMAEFLTLGPDDAQTSMWMRDAVASGKLPSLSELGSGRYFPYRWGAAAWAYLVEEFGEDLPARALREKRDVARRLRGLTGKSLDELTSGWHEVLRAKHGTRDGRAPLPEPLISTKAGGGRLNLAASLSPDGQHVVFLSERDQFSIDLFLADAKTGRILRKLITTAGNAEFESLQYLHSAGAWSRSGTHFAIATIQRGRPVLLLLDIHGRTPARELPVPQVDEVFSPTWSADDRRIAFSAMKGGMTDLYVIDASGTGFRQLTRDAYADMQPAWSPDGRTIAFATDRFTTSIDRLAFGAFRIGLLNVETGAISAAPALDGANHHDPSWAPHGSSLYFVADPDGVKNIYRMEYPDGRVFRITDVETGVSGVTRTSPVLSVSSDTGALAFSVFRRSGYDVYHLSGAEALHGTPVEAEQVSREVPPGGLGELPPIEPVMPLPAVASTAALREQPYRSRMALEAIGSPYFSAGGGPLGGYVSGGASLLFGDLLGNQQLMATAYVSSRVEESALGALYVNRSHRWNWGLTMEQMPELRLRTNSVSFASERDTVLTRERERSIWTHRSLGGFAAYALNRAQRIELSSGIRQIGFSRERRVETVSRLSGMIMDHETERLPSEPAISMAETGVAIIGDTAVFGATAPIMGSRYRLQAGTTVGGLRYSSILADYRRYMMPVRPFTIAMRLVHGGRYGQDANDIRLRDVYLGSPALVRGYDAPTVARSECANSGVDCAALNTLLANRFVAAKVELRFPVWSALNSTSRVRYGPIPMDAFIFADAGAGWGGERRFGPGGVDGRWVRSAGAGVRVNAIGMIVELAAARPLDLRQAGWTFQFNLRPGF